MDRIAAFNSIAAFWIAHETKSNAAIPKQSGYNTSETTQSSSCVLDVELSPGNACDRAATVGVLNLKQPQKG